MNSISVRNTCIAKGEFLGFAPSPLDDTKLRSAKVASSASFSSKPFQSSNCTSSNFVSGMVHDSLVRKRKHDSISELDSSSVGPYHHSKENFPLPLNETDAMADLFCKSHDGGKCFPFVEPLDSPALLTDFLDSETFAKYGQVEVHDDVAAAPEEDLDWDALSSLPFYETLLVPWTVAAV